MPCLVFLDGLGEEERAPVRQTANNAAVSEDQGAGCVGDSGKGEVLVGRGGSWDGGLELGKVLFDFVRGMRFSHADLVGLVLLFRQLNRELTTAIISYNMAPSSYLHHSQACIALSDGSSSSPRAFAS